MTILEKNQVKKYALDHAGEFIDFYDDDRSLLVGKIVGYYYLFGLLVMECAQEPINPIDPISADLDSNGVLLTKGSYYAYIRLDDILDAGEQKAKTSMFPHICNKCGKAAQILFNFVECSNNNCQNYKRP
jgi:hypothetical protein